ncbi:MAG: porin family protein [Bradyrhizobium sp.]|nr:MAG: porin family protein [Bradyrhizobium sp.]
MRREGQGQILFKSVAPKSCGVKPLVTSIIVLATLTAGARAAELPADRSTPAPAFTWTGCYVGVQAGGDFDRSSWGRSGNGMLINPFTIDASGAIGGGQAGCNYQMESFLLGAEGEIWGSSLSGATVVAANDGDRYAFQSHLGGDAALRAGYAFGRTLLYGKLGVAEASYAFQDTGPGFLSDTGRATYAGLLLGVGVEYALDAHWSVKAEYENIDYARSVFIGNPARPFDDYSSRIRNAENLVKGGVNYRF